MAGNEIALIALIFVVLLLTGLLLQQMGQPVEPPTVIVQAPPPAPVATERKKVEFVKARFLDNNEVDFHGEERLEATARRPVIVRHGNKYMCSRQDEAGTWIYRQVPF